MENSKIKIACIPEMGGKVVSLVSKRTGKDYLLDKESSITTLPKYADIFDLKYAYGFDECFPTVAPCRITHNNVSLKLPDHGELWNRPWNYKHNNSTIELFIEGKQFDYIFTKKLTISGSKLNIEYKVKNRSDIFLRYVWSTHPLLSVNTGDEILLNNSIKNLNVYWTSEKKLENGGNKIEWPHGIISGKKVNWAIVPDKDSDIAVKFFTEKLKVGRAGFYSKIANETLIFNFDKEKNPYLGLWLCYGGWPMRGDKKSFTVALEPTNVQTDSLAEAIQRKEAAKINSHKVHRWELQCSFREGKIKV